MFKTEDKVDAFKTKLELSANKGKIGFFLNIFQAKTDILNDSVPISSFFCLMHNQLSIKLNILLSCNRLLNYEGIHPFVSKAGELTLLVLEEDELLEITNDYDLKSMSKKTSNLHSIQGLCHGLAWF